MGDRAQSVRAAVHFFCKRMGYFFRALGIRTPRLRNLRSIFFYRNSANHFELSHQGKNRGRLDRWSNEEGKKRKDAGMGIPPGVAGAKSENVGKNGVRLAEQAAVHNCAGRGEELRANKEEEAPTPHGSGLMIPLDPIPTLVLCRRTFTEAFLPQQDFS